MTEIAEILERHDRAIRDLQQAVVSVAQQPVWHQNRFDVIYIDDGHGNIIILHIASPTPTGLSATAGAYYDDIYIDVDWDGIAPGTSYQMEWSIKTLPVTYTIEGQQGAISGDSTRIHHLRPNTTYGIRVYGLNPNGVPSDPTPWFDVTTTQDSTIPSQVSDVVIGRGATSVIVKFTPVDDIDVAGGKGQYLVEISNDGFATVYASNQSSAYVVAFNDVADEGDFTARVSTIDQSGNQSDPVYSSAYTAGGVIDSMLVGDFSAAHITVGVMSGDRIDANTADIAILKSSDITTQTFTLAGGQFLAKNSLDDTGMVINSQGISMYDHSGTRTIFFDAETGDGSFQGAVVATSGTIGNLDVIGGLTVDTLGYVTSDDFVAGSAGWRAYHDSIELNNALVRGPLIIGTAGYIESDDFVTTVAGFHIGRDFLEVNDAHFRGIIYAAKFGTDDFLFLTSGGHNAMRVFYSGGNVSLQLGDGSNVNRGMRWNIAGAGYEFVGIGNVADAAGYAFVDGIGASLATDDALLICYSTFAGRRDQGGNFGTMGLRSTDRASGHPGVAFHDELNGVAAFIALWGPGGYLECRNAGNSGFYDLHCATLTQHSERSSKTDVSDFINVLDKIDQVRPVRFKPKNKLKHTNGRLIKTAEVLANQDEYDISVIAEELAPIFPEAVAFGLTNRDDPNSPIKPIGVKPMAVAIIALRAVQELKRLISQ